MRYRSLLHPCVGVCIGGLVAGCSTSQSIVSEQSAVRAEFRRPVSTYSIVARDPQSGEMGVAVQSHWFSVGPIVPWAEAGVGAVATQSLVDPAYGPLGLKMMSLGKSAPDALRGLLESDEGRALRQVAMVDAQGQIAAHTGERCIAAAGHFVGEDMQFSVQANLMERDTVWPAMADAFRAARRGGADLADAMLAALDAAQAEGGDIRGKQSAAILIVRGESSGKPWEDRIFDLRVEDHPDPLGELRRLVTIQRAYLHMNAGDKAMEEEDFERAMREYSAAEEFAPQIIEITFWRAVTLASIDRVDESIPLFEKVFAHEPIWRDLVPRLVDSELLPAEAAEEVMRRTGEVDDR